MHIPDNRTEKQKILSAAYAAITDQNANRGGYYSGPYLDVYMDVRAIVHKAQLAKRV